MKNASQHFVLASDVEVLNSQTCINKAGPTDSTSATCDTPLIFPTYLPNKYVSNKVSAMNFSTLNAMTASEAEQIFFDSCANRKWAAAMTKARPFYSLDELLLAASQHWRAQDTTGILEAFQGHAKIGDKSALQAKFAQHESHADKEQGQIRHASDDTLQELADLNDAYFDKYGFIFIVCASGKSADEMLAIIKSRINNEYAKEMANGAIEQEKITALRLTRKFGDQHKPR